MGVESSHHVVVFKRDAVAFAEMPVAHHVTPRIPFVDDHGPLQKRLNRNGMDDLVVGRFVRCEEHELLVSEQLV